ncbi:uncharacterized protein LOC117302749 [Asterias rubens]|uniref:uncharacterized protein LOC117302749 n=1 Tax=Asterias rubens TaxID=7604 RepID=UPI001454E770|nr:uncharacterized protein LOC117302749 [Asterias rubens]
MAIMYKCCCCSVRAGSLVVAVWSLISGGCSAIQSCAAIASTYASVGVRVVQGLALSINVLLCLAAILLIVGVVQNTKGMLIPFIVCQIVFILFFGGLAIAVIVYLCVGGEFNYLNLEPPLDVDPAEWAALVKAVYISAVIIYALLEMIQLLCLFCVVSQYQELRDGRGRGLPPPGTTIIIQQQHSGINTDMGGYVAPTYNPAVAPAVQTHPPTLGDQTAYYSKP